MALPLGFEWDRKKEAANQRRHGVTFAEAASVFRDTLTVTVPDTQHSEQEDRWVTIGHSAGRRLLVVVHTDRADRLRRISARRATPRERASYEKRLEEHLQQ